VSVHATSTNVLGPYKEVGLTYTYQNGKGHNTTGLTLVDGTYAVLESAIVPGWIFTAPGLNGPFTYQGSLRWNGNGYNPTNVTSNLQIAVGGDHRYWAIGSSGFVLNSDTLLGTFTAVGPSIYPTISGTDNGKAEDPIIWYSGGYYHVVYNYWDIRRAYHVMSVDGVHNWISTGVAVDRSTNFLRYTDGTVNHWGNMERPNVYMENGHVAYFTFAVTDQNKDQGSNCCSTGSKVIVVPFDGVSFDADNGGLGGFGGGAGGAAGAGGNTAGAGGGGSAGHGTTSGGGGAAGAAGTGAGGRGAGGAGAGGTATAGAGGAATGAAGAAGTGSSRASSGGAVGTGGSAGSGVGAGGRATDPGQTSSGCACRTGADPSGSSGPGLLLLFAAAWLRAHRRRSKVGSRAARTRP
jgi:MYXO-CTERM domain-containing protein